MPKLGSVEQENFEASMYLDWVIVLSVIIIALTCVFVGFTVHYCAKKIKQESLSPERPTMH